MFGFYELICRRLIKNVYRYFIVTLVGTVYDKLENGHKNYIFIYINLNCKFISILNVRLILMLNLSMNLIGLEINRNTIRIL